MLPAHHKLTSPPQFRRTMKGSRRQGTRTVVVHARDTMSANSNGTMGNPVEVAATGPRFGLIVSKAVGNAVVRHRTSRRLRHVCMTLIPKLPAGVDVVIRALPASATATSEQLEKDITKALRKQWDI